MIQTKLEANAIQKRQELLVKNDYTRTDEYTSQHKDALATGDPQGKGTGHGGHIHYIPDSEKSSTSYDYSNIDTSSTGGPNGTGPGCEYDVYGRNGVGGRNFLMNISLYNENHQYGADMIDTSANVNDGQVVF